MDIFGELKKELSKWKIIFKKANELLLYHVSTLKKKIFLISIYVTNLINW